MDSIPHTFPGDVTVGFKAPHGYGVDLVTFIGGAVAGGGDGDNITNMIIDNQAVGDMLLATNAQAPYTASWLPIANSPSWPVLGFGPQEPVGELNKLNGASTQGTWQALVSDQAAVDTGTFNSWSLIVTPRAFMCQPFGTTATAGQLIISEFRVRGPSGANDEFIEIYNNSGADHTVIDSGVGTGYAVAASDGVARCVIPNLTVIPNRGHYLCTNSVAYSLSGYAAGDATYTTDIPDNAGIALFNTSVGANFILANRLDAVGSTSEANTLYKEGTGYPALTPFSIDYAFVRDNCGKQGSITTVRRMPLWRSSSGYEQQRDELLFRGHKWNERGRGPATRGTGTREPRLANQPEHHHARSVARRDHCCRQPAKPGSRLHF